MKTGAQHSLKKTAFTLVELLVVIAIMGTLMTIVGLSVPGSIASQKLMAASRQLAGDLDYAALVAQRDNHPVEVRFYRFKPGDTFGDNQIRGYQIGSITGWETTGDAKITFTSEFHRLPDGIVVMPNNTFTTLLSQKPKTPKATDPKIAPAYDYFSYQIRPDGVTTLPKDAKTVLTLVLENPKGVPTTTLPDDYRSVVINPTNSKVTSY